ncbi:MAG: imidazoleglycerol-phosphate dehydratase HisB [Bacteroidetes bacterium]|nr:imidazoleglycerol-phosphate dehydratase HisB [Bacteroidota bacterium]MXW83482.1 imidazoleglycerol-phosphate dehydratase HisB [Rhodothermaceae bacterium]MDE2672259.1 imidazoleglycerol-phosphate dehydratase HisB [Bacteroidota bacterium]MXX57523.1 imidazoleglycerol-phosphate dehydratase HisB [Rhodothermaceae bacterium]MYD20042.1 imidazoleglycerol-phosphate dehydratase HisB [Rhodothermaceae bacterium]
MAESIYPKRSAAVVRTTKETDISVKLTLDGTGQYKNQTGVGFLDHMLDLFAKHGQFDLEATCSGDLNVDEHHTVEDVGICLGQALRKALGDKARIARYGHAYVPMDEALARTVVDLSGRFAIHFESEFDRPTVGDLATELVQHFWYSFAEHAACTLHISVPYGTNTHHKIEAIFKSAARALNMATQQSATNAVMPSTKGTL